MGAMGLYEEPQPGALVREGAGVITVSSGDWMQVQFCNLTETVDPGREGICDPRKFESWVGAVEVWTLEHYPIMTYNTQPFGGNYMPGRGPLLFRGGCI